MFRGKKRLVNLLVIPMLVIVLIAMSVPMGEKAYAAGNWESEMNDGFYHSTLITLNEEWQGLLDDGYDEDYYRVTIPQDGKIVISFKHAHVDQDRPWAVQVYNADQKELMDYYVAGPTEDAIVFPALGIAAGTYYIRVAGGYTNSDVKYTFTVNFTASSTWEKEPNGDFGYSTTMSLNKKWSGVVMDSYDGDYYKFILNEPGYVSISFQHPHIDEDRPWSVQVYNADQREMMDYYIPGPTSSATKLPALGLDSGIYYVKVSSGYNWSDLEYNITLNYTASGTWEKELNGDFGTSTTISLNTKWSGVIMDSYEDDYYKFTLSKPGYVSIAFQHAHVDQDRPWSVQVYNANQTELMDYYIEGPTKAEYKLPDLGLNSGTYYIRVGDGYNWSNIKYNLTVNYTASNVWERELNEGQASSTSMKLDTMYYGALDDSSDNDFFKFQLSEPTTISITFDHITTDKDRPWDLLLYASGNSALKDWYIEGNNASTTTERISLAKGTYYLRVLGGYTFDNSTYSVTVNTKTDISKATVEAIKDQDYTGKAITPKLTVKLENTTLVEGKDYNVTFKNNTEIGTATATITGIGEFKGKTTKTFKIVHTHSLKKTAAKAATCTQAGNKAYWKCSKCGKVYSDSKATKETTVAAMKIKATGHSLTKVAAKAATCTTAGNKAYWKCSKCNNLYADKDGKTKTTTEKVTTAKLGHNYGDTWTKLNNTYHQKICANDSSHVQKEAHTWNAGKVTKKATTTSTGIKTYTCKVCKGTKKETIPKVPAYSNATVRRIFGADRYETSREIAYNFAEDSNQEKYNAIIVACGTNFPDALAASYLSQRYNAPIVVWRGSENANIQMFIKKNLNKSKGTVYLLGGTTIVGDSIKSGMTGYKFVRLYDSDRYGTNIKILKRAGLKNGEILVCDGTNHVNALIGSATGKPILLVNPNKGLSRAQQDYLATLGSIKFTVIGNEKSLPESVVKQLKIFGSVSRISGETPDAVSVNVAKKYFTNPKEIMLAVDYNFPDALSGGPLCLANNSPIFLVNNSEYSKTMAYAKSQKLTRITVFGGDTLLTNETVKKIGNLK